MELKDLVEVMPRSRLSKSNLDLVLVLNQNFHSFQTKRFDLI